MNAIANASRLNQQTTRRGLSLIEVIIAMGILVGTAAVLTQLIHIGQEQAERSTQMTDLQNACHNRLNELLCGISKWSDVDRPNELAADSIDSDVEFDITVEPVGFRDLYAISVTATKKTSVAEKPKQPVGERPRRSFRLVRWVTAAELPETFEFPESNGQRGDSSRIEPRFRQLEESMRRAE